MLSLGGEICETSVHSVKSILLLKDEYCTVMLNKCHRGRSVKLIRAKHEVKWDAKTNFLDEVCVCGSRKAHFLSFGDKTKNDSEYGEGNCPKRIEVYTYDAESAELRASIQRRFGVRCVNMHIM